MQGFLLQGQSHVLSRQPEVCQDTEEESSVSSSPLAGGISGQGRTRGDLRNEGESLPLEDEEVTTGTAWGKRTWKREHRERLYRGSCGHWTLLHTAQLQGALCPQSCLPPPKMKKEMNRGGKGSGRLELLCRLMRLSTEGDK